MKIEFNKETQEALEKLLENSSNEYIRIKVAFGCGKPFYEIFTDFKKESDIEEVINGIPFIAEERDAKACEGIEIIYGTISYNNGFYVK